MAPRNNDNKSNKRFGRARSKKQKGGISARMKTR